MSFPNIPNVTPLISITTEQTVPLLLASIAFEELALAHIINAEAEKIQFVVGTLDTETTLATPVTVTNLLDVNKSVQRTLRDVIKKEMLLEFKFENILDLLEIVPPVIASISFNETEITICTPGTGISQATLSGTVTINGNPAPDGTVVNFLVSDLTLGDVVPNSAVTVNGSFSTVFTAKNGTGTVTVFASLPAFPGVSDSVTIHIVDCTTPPDGCGCQATTPSGMGFDITRGSGASDTTVVFKGTTLPSNDHGQVNYDGEICNECQNDNRFEFTYEQAPAVAQNFVFTADTFDPVPHCPNGEVEVTGTGSDVPDVFGAGLTFRLNLVDGDSIRLRIFNAANTLVFDSTTTGLGNGELTVDDCP